MKAGLPGLVGHATGYGWPARRATAALGLDHARYYHWAARRDAGRLEDAAPGGHPLHGLLGWCPRTRKVSVLGTLRMSVLGC